MTIHDTDQPIIFTPELPPEPSVTEGAAAPLDIQTEQTTNVDHHFSRQFEPITDDPTPSDPASDEDHETDATGRFARLFDKYKTKAALGTAALSTVATLTLNPLGETTEKVVDAAPWVAGGIAASEAGFIIGAGVMLASIGSKVPLNPLKIKHKIPEIAHKANNSKLFKAGFVVNTTGAVGDFAVLSTGVMKELPVHSWGVLSLTLLDLGVTVAVRKAILRGARKHAADPPQESSTLQTAQ